MANSQYHYTPLNLEHDSIRVVTLQPAEDNSDNTIKCMILHTSRDKRPHYEALSYVWGTEKAPDPTLLDGQPFYITENLKDALIMIRHGSQKERVLWIDAICINQNDLSERSAQVRQMRQIYSSAERVLVWLGDDDWRGPEIPHIVPLLYRISAFEGRVDEVVASRSAYSLDRLAAELWASFPVLPVWKAIPCLFSSPWFKRVWTVQEIAVAQDALVLYGRTALPWIVILKAVRFLGELRSHWLAGTSYRLLEGKRVEQKSDESTIEVSLLQSVLYKDMSLPRDIIAIRERFLQKSPHDLLGLLINTWCRDATEPRDRIFAFIGLLDEAEQRDSFIDYERPVEHVYADATKMDIRRSGKLDVIMLNSISKSTSLALPSWCPDWSVCSDDTRTERLWLLRHYRYSTWTAGGSVIEFLGNSDPTVLELSGIVVGTVKAVSSMGDYVAQISRLIFSVEQQSGNVQEPLPLNIKQVLDELDPHSQSLDPALLDAMTLGTWALTLGTDGQFQLGPTDIFNSPDVVLQESVLRAGDGASRAITMAKLMLFVTSAKYGSVFSFGKGSYGVAQAKVEEGDTICIFIGGRTPFLLRRNKGGDDWTLAGPCYVSGVMHGEVMDELTKGKQTVEQFTIF